ncbi:MAG: lysophospholipid acyltransferase family protein [Chlamydiae bacterium]|nr:lysophospholipid acyltransferase family protein [Chlamydiota bacterium]MBI3266171.1 lysophospholipid acyltransferase family protein [Chlamydiota bacterium]
MKFNLLLKSPPLRTLLIRMGLGYMGWVGHTTPWEIEGDENYFLARSRGRPILFAFWHCQLMLMPFCYLSLARHKKICVLASLSRDGQIVSDFVEEIGFEVVRGSSSRGGYPALLRLKRYIDQGFDLAVTPDGPRGPKGYVQMGVVALASASHCPILPVAYDCEHVKVLETWDRFKIPRPYNRARLVMGEAVQVEHLKDSNYLEMKRIELQAALEKVNEKAAMH